eukprot:TRINITY_DN5682_c0_g1_i2.p1 TRINITY_DN5682_c0_g1~~TRINITY_DN5682_c0_g1_i2.p1  ORF type:complete len:244 (-),score=65.64 TRINITY_DN5682_c0_g1_i2:62-793(-)
MVKAGKAAGQGSQLGKLHWNRAKVSRELPNMGVWATQREFNEKPVSQLWDERTQGMSHPEIDILSAADIEASVKAQEDAMKVAEATAAAGQSAIPRGHGGQGFTYTEYPWALPDEKDPDKLYGGQDGQHTAEVLMAHGDYYKSRGEFDRAKSCYDTGMDSLILPPDSSLDTLVSAIANTDNSIDAAGLTQFLKVRGAAEPEAQAAAMLDGAEEADREEFTRLLAGYVEEHLSLIHISEPTRPY